MEFIASATDWTGKKFAVVLVVPKRRRNPDIFEEFEEFKELVRNLGGQITHEIVQKVDRPNPAFYVGKGKAKELAQLDCDVIAVDAFLTASQIANLREVTKKEVIDREYLIIKIFAQRATTREGKLQVELAELRYRLSKLIGLGQKLSRLGGGLGTRGPGETKMEELRRHLTERIRAIEREIETARKTRELHRKTRRERGFVTFALVGYTNAGKSTLLRVLTGEDVEVQNKLFTTLETRSGLLKGTRNILITDTVGFIRRLPHSLVKAFHSTLEEVKFSDCIIEVIDMTWDISKQMRTINSVLNEIGVDSNKKKILVFNKADAVPQHVWGRYAEEYPESVIISAKEKMGISVLVERIKKVAQEISLDGKTGFENISKAE